MLPVKAMAGEPAQGTPAPPRDPGPGVWPPQGSEVSYGREGQPPDCVVPACRQPTHQPCGGRTLMDVTPAALAKHRWICFNHEGFAQGAGQAHPIGGRNGPLGILLPKLRVPRTAQAERGADAQEENAAARFAETLPPDQLQAMKAGASAMTRLAQQLEQLKPWAKALKKTRGGRAQGTGPVQG